ncbi:MAG: hypothetical protein HRT58_22545 [Crocinitomicaceae bacterium]|nr:hypothetical protein [Flavobacteriales bacterium]NQZ38458.1 hypothetical protein [Crocinitomicaceae bacterium]
MITKSITGIFLILIYIGMAASCENVVNKNDHNNIELSSDTLTNNENIIFLHSIEYRRVSDAPVPLIIDAHIIGLDEKNVTELVSKYDRCKLVTPDDTAYVSFSLQKAEFLYRVRFFNCCFLQGLTENEIHASLKEAYLTFYNDSTKYSVYSSEQPIETAFTNVRMGIVELEKRD